MTDRSVPDHDLPGVHGPTRRRRRGCRASVTEIAIVLIAEAPLLAVLLIVFITLGSQR